MLSTLALLALFAVDLIRPGEPAGTSGGSVRAMVVTAGLVRAQPAPVPPPVLPPEAACGFTDLGGCVSGAVDTFLRGLVSDALNPLLTMLSDTLLTTPTLDQLPGLRQLWEQSWQIMLAAYSLLVLLAGILSWATRPCRPATACARSPPASSSASSPGRCR
jgi:hypothetical protein